MTCAWRPAHPDQIQGATEERLKKCEWFPVVIKKSIELRGSYSAGSVWHAPVAQEGVFCGRRFRWHCGSEVGLDERDDDPAVKEEVLNFVLKIK